MEAQRYALTEKQRLDIFEDGKRAAVSGKNAFSCPYMRDDDPERFLIWNDGFRSLTGLVTRRGVRPF